MYPVKIAIISDLHVGPAAKTQDMCPCPCDASSQAFKDYNKKTSVSMRQSFVDFIKNNDISADYLVIPGDITDAAHPMQVKLASEVITEFSEGLHVPMDRIIYVPGNHDLDWLCYDKEDQTGIKWSHRYSAFKSKDFIFAGAQGQSECGLFNSPYFSSWTYDNLFVLGYNSSNHDTPIEKEHRGLISSEHVLAMRNYLTSLKLSTNIIKVFIIHHHLTNLSLPLPDTPDYSLATNAQEMIALLREFKFDFVVHGHRHHPCFEDRIKDLPILCSGSFSAEIDTKWNGKVQNQFHLLVFDKKDGISSKGFIKSWSNTIGDWNPSHQFYCGIEHQIPFGKTISPEEKTKELFPQLHLILEKNNFVLWNSVLESFPDYKYLSNKQICEILSEFAKAENATFGPNDNNYIIYRER